MPNAGCTKELGTMMTFEQSAKPNTLRAKQLTLQRLNEKK
jgi:hypothetical protein